MAHELAFEGGVGQMFANVRGGTPWHQEGYLIDARAEFDFDAVMDRFFSYPLEKRPYFAPTGSHNEFAPATEAFYVYRPDTDRKLGSVGSSYEIVTNRQAFEVLKPLVDERVAALETGGVLRDGADAWLLVRWNLDEFGPDARQVFDRDGGILPYATVCANHSGRRGILLGHTSIRIVCANTLGMAENGADAKRTRMIDHRTGAKQRLAEAATVLFRGVVEQFEVIAKQYRLLMNSTLTESQFAELVLDPIAPDPRLDAQFNPDAKLAESVLNRALGKRSELARLWREGKGHTGEPTAWYAYQAAAEALDHNKQLWPTRAGSWRTASLLDGQLAQMKNAVLENLVAHALKA